MSELIVPSDVTEKHRNHSRVALFIFFGGFVTLCAFAIRDYVSASNNPTTRFALEKAAYKAPLFLFCAGDDYRNFLINDTNYHSGTCHTELYNSLGSLTQGTCTMERGSAVFPDYFPIDDPFVGKRDCWIANRQRNVNLEQKSDVMTISFFFDANVTGTADNLYISKVIDMYVANTVDEIASSTVFPIPFKLSFSNINYFSLDKTIFRDINGKETIEWKGNTVAANTRFSQPLLPGEGEHYMEVKINRASTSVSKLTEHSSASISTLLGVISGFYGYVVIFLSFLFVPIGWQANKYKVYYKLACSPDPEDFPSNQVNDDSSQAKPSPDNHSVQMQMVHQGEMVHP